MSTVLDSQKTLNRVPFESSASWVLTGTRRVGGVRLGAQVTGATRAHGGADAGGVAVAGTARALAFQTRLELAHGTL